MKILGYVLMKCYNTDKECIKRKGFDRGIRDVKIKYTQIGSATGNRGITVPIKLKEKV